MTTDVADLAVTLPPTVPGPAVAHPHDQIQSEDVGLVHDVMDGVTRWDHPRLAPAYTVLGDTSATLGGGMNARLGGLAPDPTGARRAAVGEAIERYSALHVPRSRLLRASTAQFGPTAIAEPEWLAGHDERPATHWLPGVALHADGPGAAAWVAASRSLLVHLDDRAPVLAPTSSGLASHPDPWQALLSGLAELIERDALMRTWLRRAAPAPISTALRWRAPNGRHIRFDSAPETYLLFRLESVVDVPVVLAVAFGTRGQPAVAVGAAADLDLPRACRRALIECFQTFHRTMHMLADGKQPPAGSASLHDFDDHVAYYLDPERLPAFDFLLATTRTGVPVDLDAGIGAEQRSGATEACTLVARIRAAGLTPFAVDVTPPDVREAGLWTTRAAVPGLYPMHPGMGVRLARPMLRPDEIVNPDPHPFP